MKILYLLVTALKFMGILLLILLSLLLLLVIVILTIPIKYRVSVNKAETIYAYTNIKWLYPIVDVDIMYNSNDGIQKVFKIFGIKINLGKRKAKKVNQLRIKPKPAKEVSNEKSKQISKQKHSVKKNREPIKTTKIKKDKKSKTTGIKEAIEQIQAFEYKRELLADTTKWIGLLFKSIGPESFYMYLEIGREDPAKTGELMAVLWALYPFHYPNFNIVGNYEKECLYTKIEAHGNMKLGRFIYDFIKYIRTPSMKRLIKIIRKNGKGNNNGRKASK